MLSGTDPPRRGPSPRQGECTSRPLISLEARPHRHPARPEGLQSYRPTVRPTLSRPLCDLGQQSARPLRVLVPRPIGDCRRCLHVPTEGRESLLLPSRLLHPLATPRGALTVGKNNSDRPDWQAAWRPVLNQMLVDPPLRLPIDCMQSIGSTLPNSKVTCFKISGSYVKLLAVQKDTSTRW